MGTSISNIIVVTTPAAGVGPSPVTGLTTSNISTTSLTFSWSAPSTGSPPISYQPQQSVDSGSTWANIGSVTSATSVSVTGLSANTTYQFRVIASNSTASSTSTAISVTTLSILPSAPSGLAMVGTPTSTSVNLQWQAPTSGTPPFTYQVLARSPTGTGTFAAIGSTTTSLSQSITQLNPASSYDFEVTATNLAGTGPVSPLLVNVQTVGNTGSLPGPATGLITSGISATSLTLSWTAPTSGTVPFTYQPQQAAPSATPVWTNIGSPISTTTVVVPSLTPNTAYQFQVVTTNTAGSSTSSSVTATTASVLPGVPTGLAVSGSPTTTSISLVWTTPATGTAPFTYQVSQRTPTGSGSFVSAGPTTSSASQTISGLTASTSYDFEVSATNAAGTGLQSSILVNVVTATAPVNAPGPATGLAITALAPTSLTLSWTAPSTGTLPFTYQPQQSINSGVNWTNIGSSISTTTVSVSGLTANTGYQFQVITTNSAASSTSSAVSATTLSVLPTAPTGLAVVGSPTQTSIALQWVAPASGTQPLTYQLSLRTPSGSGAFSAAGPTTTALTQTASGLTAGTAYDFEVSATNAAGTSPQSTILSNISTSAAVAVLPSSPTNLATSSITSSTVVLTWTAPAAGTPPFQYVVQYQVDPPGVPGGLTSTSVTTTSVTLAWTAPTGTPPFTYNTRYSLHNANTWTSGPSLVAVLSTVVSSLTAGTSYDFEINASNSSGTSAFSGIYTVSTSPTATGVSPARVVTFLNTIGINGQIQSYGAGAAYTNTTGIVADAQYIGARLWRDGLNAATSGAQLSAITALAQAGIKFSLIPTIPPLTNPPNPFSAEFSSEFGAISNGYTVNISSLLTQARTIQAVVTGGCINNLEGPNEPDNWAVNYNGVAGGGKLPWDAVANFVKDYYTSIKGDSVLSAVPFWTTSNTGAENPNVGLQYLTIPSGSAATFPAGTAYGSVLNSHLYPYYNTAVGFIDPGASVFQGGHDQFDFQMGQDFVTTYKQGYAGYTLAAAQALPHVLTEFGLSTSQGGMTDIIRARNICNAYLSGYLKNYSAMFLYELYNEGDGYGICSGTGSYGLVAQYMHNMTVAMADAGATAATFSTGLLPYALSGMPATAQSKLFQSSNGNFLLAIWNNTTNFVYNSGAVTISPTTVTITLTGRTANFSVFNVTSSGTVPTSTTNAVSVKTVSLTDYPLIVRIV